MVRDLLHEREMSRAPNGLSSVAASSIRIALRRRAARRSRAIALGLLLAASGCIDAGQADPGPSLTTIESLPYLSSVSVRPDEARKQGVTRRDARAAHQGHNLYNFDSQRWAMLVDMEGRPVHRWQGPDHGATWGHVEFSPDGHLFVLATRSAVIKLDWDSNVVWTAPVAAHHDLALADNGDVYVLVIKQRTIEYRGRKLVIKDNGVARISASGEVKNTWWLFPRMEHHALFHRHIQRWVERDPDKEEEPADPFHVNTIEIATVDRPGLWKRGALLIAIRNMNTLAVVGPNDGHVIWHWGDGTLDHPHHPSLLDNGNLLVFDNGLRRGRSRVVEVEPASGRIVWSYEGTTAEPFFSAYRGGSQALPNGNVLITESERARVFEVTRGGRIVWEFFGEALPDDRRGGKKLPIYRMTRLYGDRMALAERRSAPAKPGPPALVGDSP